MSTFKSISTHNAPEAIGVYSQAIQAGRFLLLSGQIGLDPATSSLVPGGVRSQLEQIFKNIHAILSVQECNFSDIVKLRIYLKEMADFSMVNEVMKLHFTDPYPVRTTLQVSGLPKNADIEVETVAFM